MLPLTRASPTSCPSSAACSSSGEPFSGTGCRAPPSKPPSVRHFIASLEGDRRRRTGVLSRFRERLWTGREIPVTLGAYLTSSDVSYPGTISASASPESAIYLASPPRDDERGETTSYPPAPRAVYPPLRPGESPTRPL